VFCHLLGELSDVFATDSKSVGQLGQGLFFLLLLLLLFFLLLESRFLLGLSNVEFEGNLF
jgi:hypothetical protein